MRKFLIFVFFSCSSQNFNSSGADNLDAPKASADLELSFSCVPGHQTSSGTTVTKSTRVKLQGEFCTKVVSSNPAPVSVVFVIDHSQSMAAEDPLDPLGSCARLESVRGVVQKIEALTKGSYAYVAFGTKAESDLAFLDAPGFSSRMNQSICHSDLGGTNYEDAFLVTSNSLSTRAGEKLVFFISDGFPSLSNRTFGRQAGVEDGAMAASLLYSRPDTSVYASLILNSSLFSVADARLTLSRMNGGRDDRIFVGSRTEIKDQVIGFVPPTTLSVGSSFSGEILAPGHSTKTFPVQVQVVGDRSKFSLSVELFQSPGVATMNLIQVKAKNSSGSELISTFRVTKEP